jgi:hypothetical protein
MSTDTQHKFRKVNLYKNNTQLTQFELSGDQLEGTLRLDSQYDPILIDSPQVVSSIARTIKTNRPVYVDDDDRLIYDSNMMETGALYEVKWKNNVIALRKNTSGKIDFYEFEPESG